MCYPEENKIYMDLWLETKDSVYLNSESLSEPAFAKAPLFNHADRPLVAMDFSANVRDAGGSLMAEAECIIIDEDEASARGLSLSECGFKKTPEAGKAFSFLENDKRFRKPDAEAHGNGSRMCSVFLDNLFVYPRFRKRGIATMLLNGISRILADRYGITVRYICATPDPVNPGSTECITGTEMKRLIKDTLLKNGFVPAGSPANTFGMQNFYVKAV